MKKENEVTAVEAAWFLGLEFRNFMGRVKRGIYKHVDIRYGKKIYDLEELRATKFIDKRKKPK